jgi:hypothetical protein
MDGLELLDISDELLIINQTTIERLFTEKNLNVLTLYLFYYKTAKWQKHNPIKASDEYCKKCLHWGIDKLQNAKTRLKEMKLIENIRRIDETGKVIGWYVKINYLIDNTTIPETTIPITPQVVKQETNTNNNKYINTNNNRNASIKHKYGTYKRIRLTDEEYTRLKEEFGEDFINRKIELLDEYIESNNNENKYTNFNLVLRKAIRENWFENTKKGEGSFLETMKEIYDEQRNNN